MKKKYRHPDLDKKLNTERIKSEAKNLDKARKVGVNSPFIIHLDIKSLQLYIQKIENSLKVKDYVLNCQDHTKINNLMIKIGNDLSKMHKVGLIHGDLTTSNILL